MAAVVDALSVVRWLFVLSIGEVDPKTLWTSVRRESPATPSQSLILPGNLAIVEESKTSCAATEMASWMCTTRGKHRDRESSRFVSRARLLLCRPLRRDRMAFKSNNKATCSEMRFPELTATASGAVKARCSRVLIRRHKVVDLGVIGSHASISAPATCFRFSGFTRTSPAETFTTD